MAQGAATSMEDAITSTHKWNLDLICMYLKNLLNLGGRRCSVHRKAGDAGGDVVYTPSHGGRCRRGCGVRSVTWREVQEGMWRRLRHRTGGAGGDVAYAPSQSGR
jgi:hypothetical protein